MFRTHTLCLVSLRIFSKYTPAKPLDTQAISTAIRPTNWKPADRIFCSESPSDSVGHCGGYNTDDYWLNKVIFIPQEQTTVTQQLNLWICKLLRDCAASVSAGVPAPEWLQPWGRAARATGRSPTSSPAWRQKTVLWWESSTGRWPVWSTTHQNITKYYIILALLQ